MGEELLALLRLRSQKLVVHRPGNGISALR
jgi:hypothetical protein